MEEYRKERSHSFGNLSSDVFKIVLTGGPCAGKTTSLARLSYFLNERGFRVFTVPEAATLLFSHGVRFDDLSSSETVVNFQKNLMDVQMSLEDSMCAIAGATSQPSVILCDRGACDGKAYVDEKQWGEIRRQQGLDSDVPIREGRYNAVFHLLTAADGAEGFYTLANNEARTESIAEALAVDRKTQEAWMGHPRHMLFDNTTGFEEKMQRVIDAMAMIVGLPLVQRQPTKFLLDLHTFEEKGHFEARSEDKEEGPASLIAKNDEIGVDQHPEQVSGVDSVESWLRSNLKGQELQIFDVEKVYVKICDADEKGEKVNGGLSSPRLASLNKSPVHTATRHTDQASYEYSFIRKRTQDGHSSYQHTLVKNHGPGGRVELKRIIRSREYDWLKSMHADPSRYVVRQRRYSFLYNYETYSVHKYISPQTGLCILQRQASTQTTDSLPSPPPTVDGIKEQSAAEQNKSVYSYPTPPPAVRDFPPFFSVGSPIDDEDGEYSAYRISIRRPPWSNSESTTEKNCMNQSRSEPSLQLSQIPIH